MTLFGNKEAQSRMNVLRQDQDGWCRVMDNEGWMGWRKKHNLTECATDIALRWSAAR